MPIPDSNPSTLHAPKIPTGELVLVLGAVLGISSNILSNVLFSGNESQLNMVAQVLLLLGVIGNVLFVLGLPGIALRQPSHTGCSASWVLS